MGMNKQGYEAKMNEHNQMGKGKLGLNVISTPINLIPVRLDPDSI